MSGTTAAATLVALVESAAGVDLGVDAGAETDPSDAAPTGTATGSTAAGTVTVVDRRGATGPADRLPSLLADAGSVVGVVPRIESSLADRLTDEAAADRDARIVLTGHARERLTGPTRSVVRSALADRGVDLYAHDGDSPVGVLLVDDVAVVGLFDGPDLAAVLTTDVPAVREWAAATVRRYLDAAEPL